MIDDPADPLYLAPAAPTGRRPRGRRKGAVSAAQGAEEMAAAGRSDPPGGDSGAGRITLEQALMFDAFEEPLMLHRAYVDVGGSIMAGLWLSYAEQIERQMLEEDPHSQGWFTLSREEWYRITGLTAPEQAGQKVNCRGGTYKHYLRISS